MLKQRIVIYAKDVERITGKSERAAYALLKKIKARLGKSKEQVVTLHELSMYTGISEEEIKAMLE